jgi:hypothetical protein
MSLFVGLRSIATNVRRYHYLKEKFLTYGLCYFLHKNEIDHSGRLISKFKKIGLENKWEYNSTWLFVMKNYACQMPEQIYGTSDKHKMSSLLEHRIMLIEKLIESENTLWNRFINYFRKR